jgi:hypothetical protein
MLHQDRVHALRQTHSTVTTIMPLLTAGLTVTGALLAAFEARNATAAAQAAEAREEAASAFAGESATPRAGATSRPTAARARSGAVRRYIATLAGRLLLVLLGMSVVLAITIAATSTGRTGQAVIITALILLTLYLVEKAARQA